MFDKYSIINNKKIISYDELKSLIDSSSSITELVSLQNNCFSKITPDDLEINEYIKLVELLNQLKLKIIKLNSLNQTSTGYSHTLLPNNNSNHTRLNTSIDENNGKINKILLISSIVVTVIMYALILITKLLK